MRGTSKQYWLSRYFFTFFADEWAPRHFIDMSKEYLKKKLIDLRARLAREKELKKSDNTKYADLIKRASSTSSKATYRKSKIDCAASHDRRIEQYKREIDYTKESIKKCK